MKAILKAFYSFYVILIFLLLVLTGFPIIFLASLFPENKRDKIAHYLLKFYSNFWSILCGIIPINYNRKKIDFSTTCIFIANHQSYYDPVEMYTAIPLFFKALGKVEVSKAPLFGVLYKMAVIPVDRSSARASALSFRNMLSKLNNGTSILLYPEGTFPDVAQPKLLRFKDGAFTLATKSNKNLQPILFLDAAKRIPPSTYTAFTPGFLRSVFLPPIQVFENSSAKELKEFTQDYMQACLDFCCEKGPSGVWDFGNELLAEKTVATLG